jgi:uncharacterized delta-60 repeat protein
MKLLRVVKRVALLFGLLLATASRAQAPYTELTLDLAWGKNGVADICQPDQPTQSPAAAWIQKDGKLVVEVEGSPSPRLVRFLPDGGVDLSFGTQGELPIARFGSYFPLEDGTNTVLQRVYVKSNETRVIRITGAGTIDASYGGNKGFAPLVDPNVGDGFSGGVGSFSLMRSERNWLSVNWGYTERVVRVVKLNLLGEPDLVFGKNGTRDYPLPPALAEFQLTFYTRGETKMPDGSTLVLWLNKNNEASETVAGYAITRLDPNGNWDEAFGRGGVLTGADIRFGFDRAETLTPLADGKVLVTGRALWKDQIGLQSSVWRLDGSKLDVTFGQGGIVQTASSSGLDPSLDFLCPPQTWYAKTVAAKFIPGGDDKTAPQVSLCQNGKPFTAAVALPGRASGELPSARNDFNTYFPPVISSAAIAHTYIVGQIGGVTLCGRFSCRQVGNALYIAKINSDGSIDKQFGQGRGFVDWVSTEPALTQEFPSDIALLPTGAVRVIGGTLFVPSASFRSNYEIALTGLTANGQRDATFASNGNLRLGVSGFGPFFVQRAAGFPRGDALWTSLGSVASAARLEPIVPPPPPIPWRLDESAPAPRNDGTAWVRGNVFYNNQNTDGTTTLLSSAQIWRTQADGIPVPNGVDGSVSVTFPPDGTAPSAITTFADDGLLLIAAPAKGALRLTRWTPNGKFDPAWGEASGTQINPLPADARGLELVDYPSVQAFTTQSGDFWLAVRYNVKSATETATRDALIFVSASGRGARIIQSADALGMAKLRPDGRLSYQKGSRTIVSVGTDGTLTTDFVQREITVAAYAFQPDGKLLVASGSNLYRFNALASSVPAPANRTVTEFYNADEKSFIYSGGAGPGWGTTGIEFTAWDSAWSNAGATGRAPTKPVYRFYGTPGVGPNSHFYTVVETENLIVRKDPGWKFEEISFYVVEPNADKTCPDATLPVYRVYNNRAAQNDSNHRYLLSRTLEAQMIAKGWVAEGVTLCAASAQ